MKTLKSFVNKSIWELINTTIFPHDLTFLPYSCRSPFWIFETILNRIICGVKSFPRSNIKLLRGGCLAARWLTASFFHPWTERLPPDFSVQTLPENLKHTSTWTWLLRPQLKHSWVIQTYTNLRAENFSNKNPLYTINSMQLRGIYVRFSYLLELTIFSPRFLVFINVNKVHEQSKVEHTYFKKVKFTY